MDQSQSTEDDVRVHFADYLSREANILYGLLLMEADGVKLVSVDEALVTVNTLCGPNALARLKVPESQIVQAIYRELSGQPDEITFITTTVNWDEAA